MAKRSVIESPPSSSEEESSSVEKHRPKKRKLESTSRTPAKTVEESGEETEEDSSDEEESSENNKVEHTKSKSVSQSSSVGSYSSGESKSLEDSVREKKSNNLKKGKINKKFSLEDEEILLNSILKFRLKKGKEVNRLNSKSFCEFLKGKLSFTNKPTPRQVSDKIYKMKKKYFGSRAARHTSEHDSKMKEIAGQIWNSDVDDTYPKRRSNYILLEKEVGKKKISVLKKKPKAKGDTVKKAEALEKKLRKQEKMEMKQDLRKMDLMKETFKLILEGTEKSSMTA